MFYLIEPWGWQNTEYMLGKIVSEMFTLASKGKKSFAPIDFMRNLSEIETEPDMTPEELSEYRKTHREEIIAAAKRDMGIKK